MPVIGGIYKHYKGGVYVVSEIGTSADDPTINMVAYVDIKDPRKTWFRTTNGWDNTVGLPKGVKDRYKLCEKLRLTVDEIAKLKHRDQDMTAFIDFLFDTQSLGNSFSSIQTLLGLLS